MRSFRIALLLAVSSLAACEVGSVGPGGLGNNGGDGDDDPVDAAVAPDAAIVRSYALAVTPASATTTLGTKTTFTVALTSSNFTGPVTLAAGGAMAGWQVAITPTTVQLSDGGTATATVEVTVPSNGTAAATGAALTIEATGAPGNKSGTAMLTVSNEYIVDIAAGTANGMHWGTMNGGLVRLKPGSKLTFKNTDTTPHRIHTNGGITGFNHEATSMPPGGSYSVTVGDGQDIFYCHDHGQGSGEVNLNVQ